MKFMFRAALSCMVLTGALSVSVPCIASTAVIHYAESPRIRFAAADIESALTAAGFRVRHVTSDSEATGTPAPDVVVRFWPAAEFHPLSMNHKTGPLPDPRPEGFAIRRVTTGSGQLIHIVSNDDAGAMYGGLELAEQIRARGMNGVADTARDPHMPLRGTKFNVPLDLRTPSYSDMSDSAQENIATVWEFDFWRDYLDQLARDRYNFVSLWNLHPFPSMVKVPEFPDVALADVWRSNIEFDEDYPTRTTGLVTPGMLANKKVVKRLTIDEKIAFWRRVMEHARDRNIAIHLVTWNIFTYGADGRYGITDAMDNPRTREYFRASVREMFRTYPLLAGIGITAGENMGEVRMYSGGVDSFDAKEQWLFDTYGQGVLDVAREDPARRIRFIHRQHESSASDIAAIFEPVIEQPNVDFVFSFKYAQAHALSSTTQTFHRDFVRTLGSLKTLWTLRNDDALMFRWAAPGFVREFVRGIPREVSAGYYVGSDMWVWGREFLSMKPRAPRQLEIDKHWLHVSLWGRLGYDPTLDDSRIAELVAHRFPGVDSRALLAAWQDASMIYPLVTGFHWANFDFQWYIEGCRSRPGPAKTASGFHSVETFIQQPVHPGSDNVPIPRFIEARAKRERLEGTTPLEVAKRIDARADAALRGVASLERAARPGKPDINAEYSDTLEDIRAMALLGKYYAAKIRGATALADFRRGASPKRQRDAVRELTGAQRFWLEYTSRNRARYRNPVWTNRVGHVDWRELDAEVAADIVIAQRPLEAPLSR